MSKFSIPARPDYSIFEQHVGQLRNQLSGADPHLLAERTGAPFVRKGEDTGEFQLEVWTRPVVLTFPAFQAFQPAPPEALPAFTNALLLYYFNTADGASLGDKWISFTELPDGRFYTQAFQGYTGNELSRSFQHNLDAFARAAEELGGITRGLGDLSYEFQALPRVPVLVACWRGDEDFAPSFKILFNASAPHYLPTDVYAIVGSILTRKLISSAGSNP